WRFCLARQSCSVSYLAPRRPEAVGAELRQVVMQAHLVPLIGTVRIGLLCGRRCILINEARLKGAVLGVIAAVLAQCCRNETSDAVGEVIMRAGRVIDTVLAGAGNTALQSAQLRDQAAVVEQGDALAVDRRQKVNVQIAFWLGGLFVADAALAELFFWPLAGI